MSKYAIVKTGGKQFRAAADDTLIVEHIPGEPGDKIVLNEVVMVNTGKSVKIGSPFVKGAKVTAEIVRQAKGTKIHGFTYKPKKDCSKRWGHRQLQTHLKVTEVKAG
jgi:large subunit ribosomal protein L21